MRDLELGECDLGDCEGRDIVVVDKGSCTNAPLPLDGNIAV